MIGDLTSQFIVSLLMMIYSCRVVVNKIENKNEQKYIKKNMGGVGGGG